VSVIIYADFTCPECYLAARRCDALAAAGVPIDFRAVEHRPELPVAGLRLSPTDQDALTGRFAALTGLLLPGEQLPWRMPALVPKSEAAVSAYAAVAGSPAAADVRRLLFELYWLTGIDIGSPNALRNPLAGPVMRSGVPADPLRQCGYAVSVDRAPVTTDAYRRSRSWRREWEELASPALPMVLTEGATLHGIDALRYLGKQIVHAGATSTPELEDPRRYAPEPVRPSASWVSQIGGRWRTDHRLAASPGPAPVASQAAAAS
jgi:hypothetical protein